MSNLSCRECGNTRHWRNLVMDSRGTTATCGVCGDTACAESVGGGVYEVGSITVTGAMAIGDGAIVIDEISDC